MRLGADAMLRIVTLRDEGVALSVVEGTATVRLAKFDRDSEYFEVDAPKTTLSAEKKGLYRIDVSREGRVRLSARDGGRARIYSETSGFALRDGRTAELIFEGADAGDWEFIAANVSDSWDSWVNERERYLAERLRYDTQYYDSLRLGRRRSRCLRRLGLRQRLRLDLATARDRNQQLRRLGALPLWRLGLGCALWLDLGGQGAVGLGALSLRPLGLLQRLLGVVSA